MRSTMYVYVCTYVHINAFPFPPKTRYDKRPQQFVSNTKKQLQPNHKNTIPKKSKRRRKIRTN